jgi:hypothetical protein
MATDSDVGKYEYTLSQGPAENSQASEKTIKCVRQITLRHTINISHYL